MSSSRSSASSAASSARAGKAKPRQAAWDRASWLAKYWLPFMLPIFRRAADRPLRLEELGAPPSVDRARQLGLRLQSHYNRELLARGQASLARALLRTFGPQLALISICDFFSKCIAYPMQTISLGWLIRDAGAYLAPSDGGQVGANEEAYWLLIYDAGLLMLFSWLAAVVSHPFFFQSYHLGMKCRVAACYLIYKKALRLSQSAMSETTVGQMVNLLSNDVNRFDQAVQLLPYLLFAPLQAAIVVAILSVFYLGAYPTLASLGALLLYVLVQTSMGRGFSKFRAKTAKRTDERVRLMNEIILAIKIIKMYAWERPFAQLVEAARRREMAVIGVGAALKALNQTLFFVSSKVIVFVALIVYVWLGNQLQPELVFVTIGLASLVRVSLTLFFPNAVAYSAETLVSCRRIDTFLRLPELASQPANCKRAGDALGCKHALALSHVHATWPGKQQQQQVVLRDLSLAVKPRELVLVVGRVGGGKSSLLMALLGELPVASGLLEVNGRVSYASQEAWIFSGSVRDNILFGRSYLADRYREVVRVCSLERDLELLMDGDLTLVGERGVSLSGGQKARVNLARALYNEADIYLLDDPLSAVDAPVARHIFNESLRTFLRDKTVVLATHQLQFLRHADKVLLLDRDSPALFGSLAEVLSSPAFAVVGYSREAFEDATTDATDAELAPHKSAGRLETTGGEQETSAGSKTADPQPTTGDFKTEEQQVEPERLVSSRASSNLNESVRSIAPLGAKKAGPASGEGRQRGARPELSAVSSNWATYRYYLASAAGLLMGVWFVLTNVLAQGLYLYTDFFLSFWTDSVQRQETLGAAFQPSSWVDSLSLAQISAIYAGLVLACLLTAFARSATFFLASLRASVAIHGRLFASVIRAPMTFFDFSPIGVLLNRLSRDIGFVDELLPQTAIEIITIFVNILGILLLTIIVSWLNLFVAAALLLLAYLMRRICAPSITRLKQLEGVTRSPIFSHLSTTLAGLATVRAFGAQDEFVRLFERHQDQHSAAWFAYICASRWLTVHMDWLCLGFILSVVSLLLGLSLDATNASTIGLLISQVVVLPGPFQWGVRQLIELESHMTSVQRVKEFSELQSEAAALGGEGDHPEEEEEQEEQVGGGRVPVQLAGEVRLQEVSLSYFPDEPPVLHSISLTIRPREKVAVVGRTGAGKSSLASILFRLYRFEGSVLLDGQDTRQMSLQRLRRSMSIIPQDPVLFGASLRKNLDPFGEFPDSHLWAALAAVQLERLFRARPQGLELTVAEGGANLSVGQRQLICLARAIIRRNQVLVLDEATANVDPETDAFIQRTIAQQFAHCTVITIAHRLITIVEADRVLVLERGQVREFDTPQSLLERQGSLFAAMVDSAAQQAPRIRRLIEEAGERKRGSGR